MIVNVKYSDMTQAFYDNEAIQRFHDSWEWVIHNMTQEEYDCYGKEEDSKQTPTS